MKKIHGLLHREEWSAAVVRAATATEIAANLVVREEYQSARGLDEKLVDHFLLWANGVHGKVAKLILPVTMGSERAKVLKQLQRQIQALNPARNSIVHSGAFMGSGEARKHVTAAHGIIAELLEPYEHEFTVVDPINQMSSK